MDRTREQERQPRRAAREVQREFRSRPFAARGTTVTMHERPIAGPGKWLRYPLEGLLRRRNTESLPRLTAIAERHTKPPSHA